MTLPGLGPVRVERGKLSQGETKAVLEKVGEEDEEGEELEELLAEADKGGGLDVVIVSTRAAPPLRRTIKRTEEEARRNKRRSRRRSSPLGRVVEEEGKEKEVEGLFKKKEDGPMRRSVSVHVGSNGCGRGGGGAMRGGGTAAAVAACRAANLRQQYQQRRKYSLGSCAAAEVAASDAGPRNSLPEVKILSVGDFCPSSSRRRHFSRLSLSQFTAPTAAAAGSSPSPGAVSTPTVAAAAKYRFVEWDESQERDVDEEDGNEQKGATTVKKRWMEDVEETAV